MRVAVLLSVLSIVALYAANDYWKRRERTTWKRTLNVALVIVEQPGVTAAAVHQLRQRVFALEARLTSEFRRYRSSGPFPFAFSVFGPVPEHLKPPNSPAEGWLGLTHHAFELFRFTRDVDDRAKVPSQGFDARLYLIAQPSILGEQAFVEGKSELGGHIGVAWAELDESMVDLALFVAAHELFHTLGASDKYDASGRTRFPDGLAEPERVPPLPQMYAEVMARNRPIDGSNELPPTSLDELAVGPRTAEEIGWSTAP